MIPLPLWIDPDAWAGFVEMRQRQEAKSRGKIVWTKRAETLVLKELYKLHDAGHDPNAALDASTLKGWTDVYAPGVKDIPNLKPRECMTSLGPKMTEAERVAADEARRALFPKPRRAA